MVPSGGHERTAERPYSLLMDSSEAFWFQENSTFSPDANVDPKHDWPFMARSIMGETATSVALESLDSAIARLRELTQNDIRPAFAALAEGTWWVAAIDERLLNGFGGVNSVRSSYYREARSRSEVGKYVPAFLWARDRHTHQLPFSMDHDDIPFFGGGSGVLNISAGFVWRPAEEMLEPTDSRSPAGSRDAYEELLERESAWATMERCSRWFHEMAGHPTL